LLLLPPRSALQAAPHAATCALLRNLHALLPADRHRCAATAPSIFRTAEFGGYVVTRFLPDDNFHVYRPTVHIQLHLSWGRYAALRHLIPSRGSSLFASPAYQHRPTGRLQCLARTQVTHRARILSLRMRCHHFGTIRLIIRSTPCICKAPAILRDISEGTSYQTVRLVFRRYAQVPGSI